MTIKYAWLEIAKKLQALAQAGLTYSQGEFDRERYQAMRQMSMQILSDFSDTEMETLERLFTNETGYPTPKVEVRAAVFREGKILMVGEKADGRWALPGGWGDVLLSPFEIAKKEVFEEAGIEVIPKRFMALLDKSKHAFRPSAYHIYQIYIQCDYVSGEPKPGLETFDAGFFDRSEIPPLSKDRTLPSCMDMVFEYFDNPEKVPYCD